MAQQVIIDLEAGIAATEGVDASVEQYIANVSAALAAALASATPVEAVQDVINRMQATRDAVTAAINANPLPS